MNPKSLGLAGLMALSALALIAVIASNPFTSQASTHEPATIQQPTTPPSAAVEPASEITQPQQFDMLQGTEEESDDSDPYIGVQITELDDGSVKVLRVVADGPSDGLLIQNDIITAVDGTTIAGASDLVDAIAEAGTGTEITLTVTRAGSSMTVNVTVGDRETSKASLGTLRTSRFPAFPKFGFSRAGRGNWGPHLSTSGDAVNSEIVVENEDGSFTTRRTVVGTVSSVDASAGTFTLSPKDGSDSIDYTISDDTNVIMKRNGDLGQLNSEDETLVVDVDGEVEMVIQGDGSDTRSHFSRRGKRPGMQDGGRWPGRHDFSDRSEFLDRVFEEIRERFDNRS